MAKDLTTSQIERQNVLNNPYALQAIQNNLDIKFLNFKGTLYVTRQMAADFYEVDVRTISNCLSANEEELTFNGYKVLQGNLLKEFKLQFGKEIDFPTKTTVLGVFDFRSFLNLGMLLTTSEKAKQLRSMMLDIVIATINEKTGGGTKYINHRDREYLPAAIQEENYHKNLTEAVNKYVDGHKTYKYAQVMDAYGNIAEYLKAVTPEEFDKFIGSKSLDFDAIMALPENQEVLKILKQAEDE